MKPLENIRVIDLSTYLAAPTVGRLMAEWGAEVIKVETISGDPYRHIGPTMAMPITEKANPNFDEENAFKNFVALNLRTPEGMGVLKKLLKSADVFLTNTRTKALEAMGLTWEKIHAEFPKLIFAQAFGYGEFGPLKDTPGFDFTAFWARSGLLVDLAPAGGPPVNPIVGMGDHCVSLSLLSAIEACLIKREKTGEGDKVDASLLQLATWTNMSSLNTTFYGRKLSRTHFQVNQANNTMYKCADGEWIYMSANDYKKLFTKVVVEVLDHPELLEDTRFNTFEEYLKNTPDLVRIYDEIFVTRTRDEWAERMEKADIAHEICQHIGDVITDPQVTANNYAVIHEYEDGTKTVVTPPPSHIASIDYMNYEFEPAKELGADNERYLKELGYSDDEIKKMRDDGHIV